MNAGLRYLLAKTHVGFVRRMRRRFQGGRGLAMLVALLLLIAFLVVPQLMTLSERRAAAAAGGEITELIDSLGPPALLLIMLLTAIRGGIYFKPAEIQFLFPAPIGRRELLVYDALSKLRLQAFSGLWIAIFILAFTELWYAAVIAPILVLAFLQLAAQALGLALIALERRFGRIAPRALMLTVLGLLIAAAAAAYGRMPPNGGLLDLAESFARLPPVALASTVTRPLVEVYSAASLPALLAWSALSLGLLALLLGLILLLDVAYAEGAIERSRKVERTLARMRSGGGAFAGAGAGKLRLRVPPFPFLKGVGPIAWRQSQELARNYRGALMIGVLMLLFVGMFVVSPALLGNQRGPTDAMPAMLPLTMLLIMLPMMSMNLAFDFRRDLDRMPLLKSLPVSSLALAVGQIVPTTLLLTAWELVGLVVIIFALGPIEPALVAGVVLGLVPFNAVLVALDNVLFLLMPYRIVARDPGRMPFMGRVMIVMFLKMLLLLVLGVLAILPVVLTWMLGGSALAAALVLDVFLFVAAVPMCFAVAGAFKRFDVSRDVGE